MSGYFIHTWVTSYETSGLRTFVLSVWFGLGIRSVVKGEKKDGDSWTT